MNGSGLVIALWAAAQAPATAGPPRLVALARGGSRPVLVQQVRDHPDDVREAFRSLLTLAATRDRDSLTMGRLAAAERLATAYAMAWSDSFLLRQVARFQSWSPAERRVKIIADSVRLAGNAALGEHGSAAAMRLWRESAHRAAAIGDTAGMAAALGNIGSAFYGDGLLDSASAYFTLALSLADQVGDWRTAGNAIGNLGSVSKDRGDLRQADSLYRSAGAIRARTGDARGMAADENNRGLISQTLGDLAGARRAFAAALEANRRAGRQDPAAVDLINLGNLSQLSGDYDIASARYRDAMVLYRATGNRVGMAEAWHDLGIVAMSRGDYVGAIRALSAAGAIYDVTGPATERVVVARDLAEARAGVGDLEGAGRELRRGEAAVGVTPGTERARAGLALARGDLALQLNQAAAANSEFARAQALYHLAGDPDGEAAALQGQGYLLLLGEAYPEAGAAFARSLQTPGTSAPRDRALTRLLLGFTLAAGGDTAGARTTITQALDTLRTVGDVVGEAAALQQLGALAARADLGFTAESLYRRGIDRLGDVKAPSLAWQLHAALGEALQRRGALTEAAAELRLATTEVEHVAARLPLEERRSAYLADKWGVYAQLALVERARGHLDDAFAASEALRARQMLDLLARGRIAGGATGGDSLAAQEQDLRLRITDLTRRLQERDAGADLREPVAGAGRAEREALDAAQTAYADLLGRLTESHPAYARLVRGQVSSLREVIEQLRPDEALLEYLVTDSITLVFVVTRDTAAVLDLGVGRRTLASLVDFARGAVARPVASAGPAWQVPLERLYQILVSPVEASGLLRGIGSLLIVPHAELHYIPFAALRAPGPPGRFLIERYLVTVIPSASVWIRLRQQREGRARGDGVLALAPRVDALPGTRAEVSAIGRVYGARARVLIGAQASRQAVEDAAAREEIIHFATFGILNKRNPLFSYVELAAQPTSDGRLEVHDVFGLDLHARLVVLSACQTAVGSGTLADVPAGDDWVGLVEAFLYAGAGNVVASLWPVEDRATADLMTRFYEGLAGGASEAEALASAQRLMLRNASTAAPFYWAGFALSGGQ